jgi:hypothetical protein
VLKMNEYYLPKEIWLSFLTRSKSKKYLALEKRNSLNFVFVEQNILNTMKYFISLDEGLCLFLISHKLWMVVASTFLVLDFDHLNLDFDHFQLFLVCT